MGGTGRDLLIGGAGDDDLRGAAVYAALDRSWSRTETGAGLLFDRFAPMLNDVTVAPILQANGEDFYLFDSAKHITTYRWLTSPRRPQERTQKQVA